MGFDFNSVMAEAQKSLKSGESNFKYKLLYPSQGTLTIKLLFNPRSNLVKRIINRHTIGEDKIACMRTYGQDCKICKVIEDAENARGIDLGKLRSQGRGISLAQFIKADYRTDGIVTGDIILFMYPWTVFKDISAIISQAKSEDDMKALIASNDGYLFSITRGVDNKYTTQVNPFEKYRSCQSDDEFVSLLSGLDDLNGMVLANPPTEDILKDVNEVAVELTNLYLVNKQPQYQTPPGQQMPMSLGNFGQQGAVTPPVNQQFAPPVNNQQFAPVNNPPQQQQFAPAPQQSSPANNPFQQYAPVNNPPQQQFAPPTNNPFGGIPQQSTPVNNNNNNNNPFAPPATAPQQQQFMPPPQTSDPNKPPCFGRHGTEDVNKCLLCPSEIQCSQLK